MSYTGADKKWENAVTKKDTPPAQPSLEALQRNTDRKAWAEDFARRRGIPLNSSP